MFGLSPLVWGLIGAIIGVDVVLFSAAQRCIRRKRRDGRMRMRARQRLGTRRGLAR